MLKNHYMKKLIVLLPLFLISIYSKSDVIPGRVVEYCVKIQNADSFPGINFVLVVKPYIINSPVSVIEIKSTDCLDKGYKLNTADVYAISKNYITEKGINGIDYPTDKNVYTSNISVPAISSQIILEDNSIAKIEEYYRIIGFRDNSLFLYLHKRIKTFEDDQEETETFAAPDYSNLKNTLEISPVEISSDLLLYPSPTQEFLNIYMLNDIYGDVNVEVFNLAGQKLSFVHIIKNKEELKETINIKSLAGGVYNLKFTIGKSVISRLFLKK